MRIVVAGSDGYLGLLVTDELIARGHDVVGLDTGYYRSGWLYEPGVAYPPTRTVDVRDLTIDELTGMDAVVHLADLSNDPLGEVDPTITDDINHRGALHLAKLAKRAGVSRFVYMSSCSVYGLGDGDRILDENSPPNPQTAYARCKVAMEQELHGLADDDFSPTAMRNATAYGASPRMRFDLVLNNLAAVAWTTGEIRVLSDGTPWRPLVHGRDIAAAIGSVLAADRDLIHDEVFNVGDNSQNYQVKEIADTIAGVFPGCALTLVAETSDNRSYRVSFDKIHEALPAFRCEWTALGGARELHDLFHRISLTTEDFADRRYTRLKQLSWLRETGQLDDTFRWVKP